ncbi:MAG: amidohydrolase [Bacteroidota bacterium]
MLRFLWFLLLATPLAAQPTVLHNARIYTVDPAQPTAEALAFEDGVLLAVGDTAAVFAAYPEAARLDAGGRTVVPGLIDAHAHLMNLGASLLQANLAGTASKAEVVERLQRFALALPDSAWVLGRGWDQNDWPAAADGSYLFPTAADLDAAFPDRPVWIARIDGHATWANTAALRAAGIDPAQPAPPNPEGGAVLRDAEGRPTGVFVDNAEALVEAFVPPPSELELQLRLERALEETSRHGLTGVHEAGVDLATMALYRAMIDAGRFPLRLYGMIGGPGQTLDYICEVRPFADYGGRLTVRSVKFYLDGALGSRGAALLEPYSDDPGNSGLLVTAPSVFQSLVNRAMWCGLQVNTHAIGDRANRIALDTYAAAVEETGGGPGRHRVEHAQVIAPEDLPRFAALGVIASVQPTHATSDRPWAEDRVGPQRIEGAYAWRSLLGSGARLALGSDFPVEPVSPLLGLYASVTRQDAGGHPEGGWDPEQRLTRAEALRGFTLDAAYAAFMEDQVGSLEPGKRADFVVLSRDIMTVPAPEILETEVVATYLDGLPIFGGL